MENKKEYSVWGMVSDRPIYLFFDKEHFMPYEIAIEKVIKYIGSLRDTIKWKEVAVKGLEVMRWENGQGDRMMISEVLQSKIMNSN